MLKIFSKKMNSFRIGFFIGTISLLLSAVPLVGAPRPIGIDVSEFQSASLNWNTLKNTYGISFAWAKAMEATCGSCGGDNWATYCANAKAAGVMIGPYHFARYDLNPGTDGAVLEANAFWDKVKNNVKADGLSVMPMLDIEASFSGQTKTTMSDWINAWCTTISNNAAAVGLSVKPCIYANGSAIANYFNSSVTQWNLDKAEWPWLNSTNSDAQRAAMAQTDSPSFAPWSNWQFWQYDDRNVAQAYTTGDGDIFNGTMARLKSTMLVTPLGLITSQPTSRTILSGSNTTFTVGVAGVGTVHFQWQFNHTNIIGATSSSLLLPDVQMTDAGFYTVIVTDNRGMAYSDDAILSVQVPLTNSPGSVVAPSGLVNWWPADGSTDDIQGGANRFVTGDFSYGPGKKGMAFHFDGFTSMVTNTSGNMAVPWTLSLWVNRSNSPQTSALLVGDGTYALKLEQYNAMRKVGITVLGKGDYVFSPNYTVPQGVWTHLAFVGTANGTTVYANGVLKGSLTNSIPLPRKYMGAAYITSSRKYVDFMLGSLDEVMIFNRDLSASEIASIYSAGAAGLVRGPEITDVIPTGPTQITLKLRGRTGKNYTIYSSSDLNTWISLGPLNNSTGTNQFIDNNATVSQKFYRVSQPY
jgi:GH25 family lysozyme M1 (1,4-beta-N-acetylmuramidase)